MVPYSEVACRPSCDLLSPPDCRPAEVLGEQTHLCDMADGDVLGFVFYFPDFFCGYFPLWANDSVKKSLKEFT